jgi:stress response protein YsnF
MFIGVKGLHGTSIHAKDGIIGKVVEALFDDKHWTVRYLIVETGHLFARHKVLLSPMSFAAADWKGLPLNVNLTREQIENSPDVDTDKPVSRQWEMEYHGYYGWPYYWGGMGSWGTYWYPGALLTHSVADAEKFEEMANNQAHQHDDVRLRSTKEVSGYAIYATDGHIGNVDDFIVDDETWRICYLAVNNLDWWHGKAVLLPPEWIGRVDWPCREVTVNVTRDQVKNSPEWDPSITIDKAFEEKLYKYYNRQCRTYGEDLRPDQMSDPIDKMCIT